MYLVYNVYNTPYILFISILNRSVSFVRVRVSAFLAMAVFQFLVINAMYVRLRGCATNLQLYVDLLALL